MMLVLIQRGDVTQMSFGFRTISDEFQMVDGEVVRTLKAVRLFDVSPVTFPAYPQTDVAARSLEAFKAEIAAGECAKGTPALDRMRMFNKQASVQF